MSLCINREERINLRNYGFTLIEILISITVLSIVIAAIYSTFFLSHKAVMGMDETVLKIQEVRRAIDILKCELDSVYYETNDENTFLKIKDRDFYGKQASSISFTTFSTLRPGLSKISYFVENKEGRLNLFKRIESPYVNEDNIEDVDIIEDIDSFSIEVMYNGKWIKLWDTEISKNTPQEIKISISFRAKDRIISLFDIATPKIGSNI